MAKKLDQAEMSSMGGKTAAANMTPEERSERAKLAAESRWASSAYQATHVGEIAIGGMSIACAILEDGTRLLTQESFLMAIGRSGKPAAGRGSQFEKVAPFLDLDNLKPFVDKDLANSTKPVVFRVPSGTRAYGYRAELLPRVCDVYLRARDAGRLLKSQENMGKACDILIRALAHVGIIALVDEATGYQDTRARDALAKILEAFVAKELQPYMSKFPPDFYRELFRLRGLPYNGSAKRPRYIGTLTNNLVYQRLAPGVLEDLKKKNPTDEHGRRKHKHFQWLTEDVGNPALAKHLEAVITLMKVADEWSEFDRMLNKAKPIYRGPTLFDGVE